MLVQFGALIILSPCVRVQITPPPTKRFEMRRLKHRKRRAAAAKQNRRRLAAAAAQQAAKQRRFVQKDDPTCAPAKHNQTPKSKPLLPGDEALRDYRKPAGSIEAALQAAIGDELGGGELPIPPLFTLIADYLKPWNLPRVRLSRTVSARSRCALLLSSSNAEWTTFVDAHVSRLCKVHVSVCPVSAQYAVCVWPNRLVDPDRPTSPERFRTVCDDLHCGWQNGVARQLSGSDLRARRRITSNQSYRIHQQRLPGSIRVESRSTRHA